MEVKNNISGLNNVTIQDNAIVGYEYNSNAGETKLSDNSTIRTGTTIYGDVTAGEYLQTGHNVLIREKTVIGKHVTVGTNVVIDGNVEIGDFVKIETNCYIPTHVKIGSRCFFGPGITITNDKYPLKMRDEYKPEGPIFEDDVTIGGGVTILPGVKIGKGSFVAAGAIVTKDIPENSLVVGVPGKVLPLPENLKEQNIALSWRKFMNN